MGNKKTSRPSEVDKDNDWVLVKKQKVTILIPPLPLNQQSPIPNPTLTHLFVPAPSQSPPIKTHRLRHSVSDGDKSVSYKLAFKILSSPPISTVPNLKRRDASHHRIIFDNPRVDRIPCNFRSKRYRTRTFLDGNVLLNQGLRALNLERKLQRVGGLSSWLASKYLRKRVGRFQLVNLTMKKLKDMGANAVGPRRKLMTAIVNHIVFRPCKRGEMGEQHLARQMGSICRCNLS